MIKVTIGGVNCEVLRCCKSIYFSMTLNRHVTDGVDLKVRVLPKAGFNPVPPSRKKRDRVWGVGNTIDVPMIQTISICTGMTISTLRYQCKVYDMNNEVEAELLYQKLSTDLALDNL